MLVGFSHHGHRHGSRQCNFPEGIPLYFIYLMRMHSPFGKVGLERRIFLITNKEVLITMRTDAGEALL